MYLGHPGRIERRQFLRDLFRGQEVRGRRRQDRVDRSRLRPADAAARADRRAAARPAPTMTRRHDQTLGTVAGAHRAGEPHRVRRGRSRRSTASTSRTYARALALVDRPQVGLLARDLGLRRRARHAGRPRAGRRRPDAGRALVPGRAAQLRAEPARAAARRRRRRRARVLGRGQGAARASRTRELHALASRVVRGAGRARRRRRRPRRRLPAEHARDDHRDARRVGARRDLVVVLARLRRAGRARPLRTDRAARAVHRRRLLVQRQGRSRSSTRSRRSSRGCRRSSGSSSCRTSRRPPARRTTCRACAMRCAGTSGSRRSSRGRSTTRRCRSTIRCTSCTRRARPACPSASCTAPAARCCST